MTAVMVCVMIPSVAFAASSSKAVIDEVKAEQDFSKVLEQALAAYAEHPQPINMIPLGSGTEYCRQSYTLDDGTALVMEFIDSKEETSIQTPMEQFPLVMPTAINGETLWKDYGNRYFTAKATVTTTGGSGWASLENHYTLSAEGIDERYGVANASENAIVGNRIEISASSPLITDKSARTVGASDVNMHAEYLVRSFFAGQPVVEKSVKLETAVGYVAHNQTTKQIQVKHSWSLQ